MESAKQKFQEAVEKTRAPGGKQLYPTTTSHSPESVTGDHYRGCACIY